MTTPTTTASQTLHRERLERLPATVDGKWVVGTPLARWPAILSGAVISFLLFVTLSAFWIAIAATNEGGWWADNLEWWEMGSAIFAAGAGAYAAGWMQSVRGSTPGALTGLTVWGLTLFGSFIIGVPSIVGGFTGAIDELVSLEATGGAATAGDSTLEWAVFIAFAGGLLLAALAGAAGGRTPRPSTVAFTSDGMGNGHGRDVDRERDLAESREMVGERREPDRSSGAHRRS